MALRGRMNGLGAGFSPASWKIDENEKRSKVDQIPMYKAYLVQDGEKTFLYQISGVMRACSLKGNVTMF